MPRRRKCSTLDDLISRKHVVASTLALTNQMLEKELRRRGAKLKIGIDVPYLLAVPVGTSDFIATVPEELAELFARLSDVDTFPLPIALPELSVRQFWHARHHNNHNDAGHRWFRALVAQTLGQPTRPVA
jgi:DNA-binding transcriptional LysR family regulator